jgi:hypothetical protein
MDAGFGPGEGNGTAVVAGDEVIDVVPERSRQIAQPTQALARKARAPSADPPRPGPQLIGDRAGRAALRSQQNDAGPPRRAVP